MDRRKFVRQTGMTGAGMFLSPDMLRLRAMSFLSFAYRRNNAGSIRLSFDRVWLMVDGPWSMAKGNVKIITKSS